MPHVSPEKTADSYDVIVVGSGAGGGQAAYTLAMEGARVLMLEAGRDYNPATETPMFQHNGEAPLRGVGTEEKFFGFHDATVDGGWQVPGEPYVNASEDPAREFWWWRSRMLGGRTNHWARISLRNGPYDFKPHTRDGLGFDWPISYDEVAPYYDKVEMLIGVHGENDGLENTPNSSPGVLQPAPKPRVGEHLLRQRGKQVGVPFIAAHRAVLTRPLDHETIPKKLHPGNPEAQRILAADMRTRAACFWATPCGRGCSIRANYQSTTVHLPPALATGRLDIVTQAMAREVEHDANGKATGVLYIDKRTGRDRRARGRVVVVAASACESVRLLLQSKSTQFPAGLGNSSGLLGKYIMDTVGGGLGAQVPLLESLPPLNDDGAGGMHVYAPWWLYQEQLAGKLGFARGYHIELTTGRGMPDLGSMSGAAAYASRQAPYGKKFKQEMKRYYGSFIWLSGRGEMIPNEDSYCELDPGVKDKWGLPVLRFHWKWSEHELKQVAHMQTTFASIYEAMGGRYQKDRVTQPRISKGGEIIHEVGGAIMGTDARKSVTNRYGRLWDSPNVFLTDGAPFCSNADKNPTLTIMALAWRTADHILESLAKGDL